MDASFYFFLKELDPIKHMDRLINAEEGGWDVLQPASQPKGDY